jgi:hypothetical protein
MDPALSEILAVTVVEASPAVSFDFTFGNCLAEFWDLAQTVKTLEFVEDIERKCQQRAFEHMATADYDVCIDNDENCFQ